MTIYLYVIIFYWGSAVEHRFEMPDMSACERAIEYSSSDYSIGAENEAGHVMFCATDVTERHYSATWWTDERKKVKE